MTSPLTKKEIEKLIEEKLKDLATFYSVTELATKSEIKELIEVMDKKFDAIDKRFEAIDKWFEDVDKRFEAVDRRFEELIVATDRRVDTVFNRFDELWL